MVALDFENIGLLICTVSLLRGSKVITEELGFSFEEMAVDSE